MTERPKTLAEIQENCRRLADEIRDPDVAIILYRAAHDLLQCVRKERGGRLN